MSSSIKKTIAFSSAWALPLVAFAQTIQTVLSVFKQVIDIATIVVISLALLAFLWGLFKYLWSGPGENQDAGRQLMIWGIIALFVMVAVWGLVRVLSNTFGVQTGGGIPGIPSVGGVNVGGTSGTSGNINVSGGINIPFGR